MGAEGANWIGEAPFSTRGHVFQNIGDGTYQHSGSLAIRAAVAAKVNITYKVLFNDAVAMTGGQPVDGDLTVAKVAAQVAAEGANRIVIVSDEPDKYGGLSWPFGTTFHHRDAIDAVQQELATQGGVSVMIYDQTCAAEKRRRRKRGLYPDPDRRVVINELVCEGCGDCGVQSNCVAIVPVETEFGRKRAIDQSSCNKDFSCLKGFCPSLVTVHGAVPRQLDSVPDLATALPEPKRVPLTANYAILITGVGGTGVVTIGALLAMAAHLDGRFAGVIDMAGLAQKGGAVTSHVRLAPGAEDIKAIRVPAGGADVILGGDLVVTGSARSLAAIDPGRTRVYVNAHETLPGDFTRDADFTLPARRLLQAITFRAGPERARAIDATRAATALLGDSIGANLFLLGLAWQAGSIPLSREAIERAIELNGVDVELNKTAFTWGRRAALEPDAVTALAERASGRASQAPSRDLDDVISRRVAFLTDYQSAAYAARYRDRVEGVRVAETRVAPGQIALTDAVARNLFKLMAVKDEYEVARLFTDGSFDRQLRTEFASWKRIDLHLAPPLFASRDPATGRLAKTTYGPWMFKLFRGLARLRRIRGTFIDPFSWLADRRMERRLLADYEATLATIVGKLSPANHGLAVPLAQYPEKIRGYGHVKLASVRKVAPEANARHEAFLAGAPRIAEAAE
jgi:indolepyruvate ferredoxin oxidoreductase